MKLWEQIGVGFSIIAVIVTLVFNIYDRKDTREQLRIATEQHKMAMEQIEKTEYDKLYSDVSQGFYSGKKLEDAIKRILDKGDDLSGMNLSKKWLPGITILKERNLYAVNFEGSTFYSSETTDIEDVSDFSGSNLGKASLQKTVLVKANLEGADLDYANLEEAILDNANLQGASLNDAILKKAILYGANLEGAFLNSADLQEARLDGVNLQDADLWQATLQGASIGHAKLKAANFQKADLQNVNLQYSDLRNAKLIGANLQGASFFQANLQNACLNEANLQGANLEGANLAYAQLVIAKNLTIEQLSKVKTLYDVQGLDSKLMEQVKVKYPHLLKEPK